MAKSIALLLGVHAHQPVGNFEVVLNDAHTRCYGPFLQVLHQYPDFHFSIHLSGWLLQYMLQHFADDMALLKDMVTRGQVELFGAGFTEPVLAAIPNCDRIGQITRLSDCLHSKFGVTPSGAWLTERVWEPTVVPALADAGIQYVTVDDYHFLCTGKHRSALGGYYSTEEDGRRIDLFPISEALRYRLPFSPAHEVVAYLEHLAEEGKGNAAIYFDDIEKFGIWPQTYEWVYERGWLRSFIEGVLASERITPMRYGDYHATSRTRGVVYLPTASYSEMNEWTLPVPAAHHYADLVHQEQHSNHYDVTKPFIRGGIWRNFFMRYPESNWMHKRMLQLSERFHALPASAQSEEMLTALYECQANDAYWHGLFGGLYLPHLRRAIFRAILTLEAGLDAASKRVAKMQADLDMDGFDEVFLQNGKLQVVAKLDGSGTLCEFDAYSLQHNFADTLTRQVEHYHRKVHARTAHHQDGQPVSPHESLGAKHDISALDLTVDSQRKSLFVDSWQNESAITTPVEYQYLATTKNSIDFTAELFAGRLSKRIMLERNSLTVRYECEPPCSGIFQTEINLAMPSCDGLGGRFRIGENILGGFGQQLMLSSLKEIVLEDEVLRGALHLHSSLPCAFRSYPYFSVSQSESGFEKIMQAVTLVLRWPAESLQQTLEIHISVDSNSK